MTKVLLLGDSVTTPSGFGTVAMNIVEGICKPLVKNNIELAHLDWQYAGNVKKIDPKGWEKSLLTFPIHKHRFGADSLGNCIASFKPDIILTLGDMWMVNFLGQPQFQKMLKERNVKWYWYLPIDEDEIPIHFVKMLKIPDKIIAMSKAGGKALDDRGIEHDYIPHGVDTNIYKPLNKTEIKKKHGHNDNFVIGSVARNQDRKQIPRLIKAFALFKKDKKDAFLHLHCDCNDPAGLAKDHCGGAFNMLVGCIRYFNIVENVGFTRGVVSYYNALSLEQMAEIYNCFDVHALATSGEGFGLPIIESIACGVPNVMTDYTTANELISGRGELAKVKTFIYGAWGTWRAIVDEEDMAAKFEKLYQDWKSDGTLLKEYSKNCVEFAAGYDWKTKVIPMWVKLLEDGEV